MLNLRQKTTVKMGLGMTAMVVFGLFSAFPAAAQFSSCQTQNSDGSIQCSGANRWCGNTCQSDPGLTCGPNQNFSCGSCTCQCNTASFPCGGCTAASSTPNVTACGSPIGGVYSDQCSATCVCPIGTANVSGTCVGYAFISPASPQSGFISVIGDMRTSGGDMYLSSGKAIRVDGPGATSLSIGNYLSVASTDVVGVNIDGMLSVGATSEVLGAAQNLFYGSFNASGSNATSSALLIEDQALNDLVRVDRSGNLNAYGSVTGRLGLVSQTTLSAAHTAGFGSQAYNPGATALITGTIDTASTSTLLRLVNEVTNVFTVGSTGRLDIGNSLLTTITSPQSLIYGIVSSASDGFLLRLQKWGSGDMLTVDANGNLLIAGQMTIQGGTPGAGKVLTSNGVGLASWQTPAASGVTFAGFATPAAAAGGAYGSYAGMNATCNSGAGALAGSHMCSGSEILSIIAAQAPANPFAVFNAVLGQSAWVASGPPGFTSPAVNDCNGWSSSSGSAYGAIWTFADTGGRGYATTCSSTYKIACCK